MMLGLDDINELTKMGLTNLDVIIIGETVQYKDFMIDDETVSLIITKYLSTWRNIKPDLAQNFGYNNLTELTRY